MANYYVYCEAHGKLNGIYSTADAASIARKQHIINVLGPHGKVNVIEEYSQEKYGQTVKNIRKYRKP